MQNLGKMSAAEAAKLAVEENRLIGGYDESFVLNVSAELDARDVEHQLNATETAMGTLYRITLR